MFFGSIVPAVEKTGEFSRQIQKMFGAVAPRYDLLNCLLSAGRDRYWRKVAVNRLALRPGDRVLDLAAGTVDVALEIAKRPISQIQVAACDFSLPMLRLGQKKIKLKQSPIFPICGDGLRLPFRDQFFSAVICAFGIRNFSDVPAGLNEVARVLDAGGRVVILEFSLPRFAILKFFYKLYFNTILPLLGRMVSGHQTAYTYLPQSVAGFFAESEFAALMQEAGFGNIKIKNLTLGVVTIYYGFKQD